MITSNIKNFDLFRRELKKSRSKKNLPISHGTNNIEPNRT